MLLKVGVLLILGLTFMALERGWWQRAAEIAKCRETMGMEGGSMVPKSIHFHYLGLGFDRFLVLKIL